MPSSRWVEGVAVERPGRMSPAFARWALRWLDPVVRVLWRPTLEGEANLPATGPFLLVANHSAGLGVAEILSVGLLWLRRVGVDRPLAGYAHPIGFRLFPLTAFLRAVGAIPSTYDAAERALAAGAPILMFPGGDHETLRPLHHAHRVDFGGRVGFLRIARAAGVPVVPLGIRGGHFTAPVLVRSRLLATLLVAPRLGGVKRWGVSLLGLVGAAAIVALVPASPAVRALLVWLWLGSPLVFLPWVPWTLRLRIGAPIAAADLFPAALCDGTDADLKRALARVQAAVQALVDG